MKIKTQAITPDMALEWLAANKRNRPINKDRVDAYSRDMTEGRWMLNGAPIVFDINGDLLDGQHRLAAIMDSERTIISAVAREADPDIFPTIDTGAKRTNGHILFIAGKDNANALAAAARWAVVIPIAEAKQTSQADNICANVTSSEVLQAVEDHPLLNKYVSKCRHGFLQKLPCGVIAVFTLYAERFGEEIVDHFLDQLDSGEQLSKGSPALTLRETFHNYASTKKTRTKTGFKVAMAIKAMNHLVHGTPCKVLRFATDEPWPVMARARR